MTDAIISQAILADLNEAQRRAVLTTEGPVLILAGAGSGKTKCLTHRLAYLVSSGRAEFNEILCVTFTNKAAEELSKRILKILNLERDFGRNVAFTLRRLLPWVGTFHSICVRILRENHESIGLTKNFTIFDSEDSLILIRQLVKQLNFDSKQYSPAAIRAIISNAKNELLSPNGFADYVQGHFQAVALEVYRAYQKRLYELSALDFDDLIMATVKLLEEFPEIKKCYHQQFKYVMVDEYQDTNHAQYRLTSLLVNPKIKNICVVGDDWQSIYGWRGANFQNILNFNRDYPGATVCKLEQNYRSTKVILQGASHIAERLKKRAEKRLWTNNEKGPPITVYEATTAYGEAEFIVSEMKSLRALGYLWSDFAALHRVNAQSRILEEVFLAEGVPYRLIGAVRFYERKEVKDLLAYLRYLTNPKDLQAFERIVNTPPRGIGPKTLKTGGEKVVVFKRFMDDLRQDEAAPRQLLEAVIAAVEYREYLLDGTPEGEARWENVEELLNLASEFESVDNFLEHVALVSDVDNFDPTADAVTLMTLHSSKGLEFTTVFLVGLEEGLFPHIRALDNDHEMDEERRLCYVGMTRARKRLYLTLARQRIVHGGLTATTPSRFIREIDEALLDRV